MFNVTRRDAKNAKASSEVDMDWAGPYIDTWHSDPWGSAYEIFNVASSRYVQSRGANGIDETPGDDVEVFMTVNP